MLNNPSSPNSPTPVTTTRFGWFVGAIFVLALGVYSPALGGAAFWDDLGFLNSTPGSATSSIANAFIQPFGNYFRPLTSLSFVIENMYAHGNPFFYHLDNILLHALTSVALVFLVLRLTKNHGAALLAGGFFAIQTTQVGATAWIGGRTDTLSCLFLTLFLICVVALQSSKSLWWTIGSWLTFFLAALSKEQAVAILPCVPLAVFAFGSRKWTDAIKATIPFLVILVVYFGLWYLGGPAPKSGTKELGYALILSLKTLGHYGTAFLVPTKDSVVTFTLENRNGMGWAALGLTFAALIIYFVLRTWKKNPVVSWLAVCALCVYLPISNFPPLLSFLAAPYRCAEAGIGIACVLGIFAHQVIVKKQFFLAGLVAANVLTGFYVTCWGIQTWLKPLGFFETAIANDPHFLIGVEHLGNILNAQNRFEESAKLTDEALSWVYSSKQWVRDLESGAVATSSSKVLEQLHKNTGIPQPAQLEKLLSNHSFALAATGRREESLICINEALKLWPGDSYCHFLYARLVIRQDRQQALHHIELAVRYDPGYREAVIALAAQRIADHRFPEAVVLLKHVGGQTPQNGLIWLMLCDAKLGLGDAEGAKKALDLAAKSESRPDPTVIAQRQARIDKIARH